MKIAATTAILLSYASSVLCFPMCTNGATPLMESNDAFPCSKGCPLGFNCEYQDSQLNPYKGICCADTAMLNNIYGEENSMHTDPIWDRNAAISSTNKPVKAETEGSTPQSSPETTTQPEYEVTVTSAEQPIEADSAQTVVVASEVEEKSKGVSGELVSKGMETQMLNQTVTVIGSEEEVKAESVNSTEAPEEGKTSLSEEVTSFTAMLSVLENSTQPSNETTEEAAGTTEKEAEIAKPIVSSVPKKTHVTTEPVAVEPPFLTPVIETTEKSIILDKPLGTEHDSEKATEAIFVDTHAGNTDETSATVTPSEVSTGTGIVADIESPMEEVGIFGRLPIPRDSLTTERREYSCARQNYSATCQDGSLNTQPTIRWAWSQLTASCEFYQFGYCPGDRIVESLTIRSREECVARCSRKDKAQMVSQPANADVFSKEATAVTMDSLEVTTAFSAEIADGFGEIAHSEAPVQVAESTLTSEEDLQNQYEMGENKIKQESETNTVADVKEESTVGAEAASAGAILNDKKVTVAMETNQTKPVGSEDNSHNENTEKTVTVVEDITMDENKKKEITELENKTLGKKTGTPKEASVAVTVAPHVSITTEGYVSDNKIAPGTEAETTPCEQEQKEATTEEPDRAATIPNAQGMKEENNETPDNNLDKPVTVTQANIQDETSTPEEAIKNPSNSNQTDQYSTKSEPENQKLDKNAVGSEVTAEFQETAHGESKEMVGAKSTESTTKKTDSVEAVTENSEVPKEGNRILATKEDKETMDKPVDKVEEDQEEENAVTEKKLRAELICSTTNYRMFCLSGMPTQFVYRWHLTAGECHSFPYGYCFGEFNHGHPRTKLECEQYCIDGKPLI